MVILKDRGKGVGTRMNYSRFQVRTPYNEQWIIAAHKLGGNWRPRSHIWSMPRYKYQDIAKELNRIFGTHLPTKDMEQDVTP